MEQLIGKTLNRYTILNLLGKGGIGAVYRARDTLLQRDVAIKVLSPEFARRPNFRERFLQEARAAARLDHPNIVRVHDFGRAGAQDHAGDPAEAAGDVLETENDFLYIVMEYIPGDNLRKVLDDLRAHRQWVLLAEAVQIVQQVAQALEYAHNQGVLHLDIKPSNLMLKPAAANGPDNPSDLPYRVLITDLGLAQLVGAESALQGDSSMGTPAYMSPEQVLGRPADARSDIYSLGVLLFELSTGRVPFPARTITEAARYHANEPVPSPRSIRPDLPVALERVILRALQKDPNLRYAATGELAHAMEEVFPSIQEVAFRPEEVTQTVSLVTQVESTVADEPLTTRPGGRVGARRLQDYVEILLPDHTVRTVPMQPDGLAIGRDPDNDIVLDHAKVSRHHARIQYDGVAYWASDLNSKNGTFVANQRLIAGEPVQWTPDQALQIGDFWLRLKQSPSERLSTTGSLAGETVADQTVADEQPLHSASSAERVGLFLETVQLSATPGASVTARLVVINTGPSVDQFRLSTSGIPNHWIPNPPPVLRLLPGAQQEVEVAIHPPLSPQTRPGRYPLTFRAAAQAAPGRLAEAEAILTVGVYTQFTSELRPRQISANGAIHVTVQNGGNARQAFTVTPADRVDEVVFDPPQAHVALSEGETAAAEFTAAPRRPRLFGGTRSFPFSVQVATSSGETQTHNGEILTSGIIPLWVLPILLLVCLCAAGLAAYGYIDVLQGPDRARQTALAGTQAAFMTQTAVLAAANQGTLAAFTATAVWNAQDADNDGLPNGEELRLGTALDNPDTDGDTIPDGFEVFQFKCTDPRKADTDADGLPDNQDPDPCAASTATFTNTPVTPSPTFTASPTNTNVPIVITDTPRPATFTPTFTTAPPTLTLTPAPQITPTPLGGSYIVEFDTNRDGNYEIYAMLGDGTRQTRVTNNAGDDTDPAMSPNGLRTVFVSNRDGNAEIYMMNVDGSAQTRLTDNPGADTSPAWSADEGRIAFVSDRDGNKEIYVMNANGSGQTRLTNNTTDDDHPAWSPDGSRIVFDSDDGSGRSILLMNANGTGLTPLVDNGASNQHPVFAPDGMRIAYASNSTGSSEIYLMNADGSSQAQLTNLALNAFNPEWSNDGTYLLFHSRQTDNREIYRIDVNGGGPTNLTNNSVDDANPTW